jgi:triphosphoribosyl-dephospho-CoA synthase
VAAAAEAACLLELRAEKPGNVWRGHERPGLRHRDLLASAQAIEPVFLRLARGRVGRLVLEAVRATRRHVTTNTNLGIVLLLAPLAKAALLRGPADFRERLQRVLDDLDLQDARDVYAAIRLARPGGLGRVGEEDIRRRPGKDLLAIMRLAAGRDAVAREYATGYEATFEVGAPALKRLRAEGLETGPATVETFLILLAASPDTLIARRHGLRKATAVSRAAASTLERGGTRTPEGRAAILELDRKLVRARPAMNPGATADLTTASLFVWLVESVAHRPAVG